eukprot:3832166-Amphidinium_carterae.2
MIKIAPGLKDYLKTDECIQLTRQTINAFESFQTCTALSESRLLSVESLKCLYTPGANKDRGYKVRSTRATQAPEVFEQFQHFIEEVKSGLKSELAAEQSTGTMSSSATLITIQLKAGEESMTCSVACKPIAAYSCHVAGGYRMGPQHFRLALTPYPDHPLGATRGAAAML